ncbi:MAG: hypothetical protein AAGD06_02400 [Acidobacteriota bacterium]
MSDKIQSDRFLHRLEAMGLDENDVHRGTLDTSEGGGPFILSGDPAESRIPPKLVTVASLAEMKAIYGVPDEHFDRGQASDHHLDYPEPLADDRASLHDRVRNLCDLDEQLSWRESEQIRRAAHAFVYGDSRRVASYEPLINAILFPTQVARFAGDSVVVKPGHPLVFKGEQPVEATFDNVVVEPGGEIITDVELQFSSTRFVQESLSPNGDTGGRTINVCPNFDDATQTCITETPGTGTIGGAGGTGGQGRAGTPGNQSSGKNAKCTAQPGNGGAGGTGGPGTPGSAGAAGVPLQPSTFDLGRVTGTITVNLGPGDGQQGGKGGTGGTGGEGGQPGTSPSLCGSALKGAGGRGGVGGKGGTGGTGGNGATIQIFFDPESTPDFVQNVLSGRGGQGGTAGEGGDGGPGSAKGPGGSDGIPGPPGGQGTPGNIVIRQSPSNSQQGEPSAGLQPLRAGAPDTIVISGAWGSPGSEGCTGGTGGTGGDGYPGSGSRREGCKFPAGAGDWGGNGGPGGPGGPAGPGSTALNFTLRADVYEGPISVLSRGGTGGTGGDGGAGGAGGAGGNAGDQPAECGFVVPGGTGGTGGDGGFGGAAGNGGNGGGVFIEYTSHPPQGLSASSLGGAAGSVGAGGQRGDGGGGGRASDDSEGTRGQVGSTGTAGPAGNVGVNGSVFLTKVPVSK